MNNIVIALLPLFFTVAFGYWVARHLWLSKAKQQKLSQFTFNGCIPVFLFVQIATANIATDLTLFFFASFYLPVLAIYLLAATINYFYHPKWKLNKAASAVFALGASYSNNVIIGIPIILSLFSAQALIYVFAIVTFHSALLFTLTSILNQRAEQVWYQALISSLFNPLVLSITLGALAHFSQMNFESSWLNSLKSVSQLALYLALFCLGTALNRYQLSEDKRMTVILCVLKLLILPTLVLLTTRYIFHLPLIQQQILVLMSSCPIGVNAYLVAANYQQQQQTVASGVVASSILATISIPIWILITQNIS